MLTKINERFYLDFNDISKILLIKNDDISSLITIRYKNGDIEESYWDLEEAIQIEKFIDSMFSNTKTVLNNYEFASQQLTNNDIYAKILHGYS